MLKLLSGKPSVTCLLFVFPGWERGLSPPTIDEHPFRVTFRKFGVLQKTKAESRTETSDECYSVTTFTPLVELSPLGQV